jgi:hypothetical protein
MKLSIRHEITLDCGAPARAQLHLLLTPFNTPQQKVERWAIDMPGVEKGASFRDGFGNKAQLVTVLKPEGPIRIVAEGVVETVDKAGVLGRLELDPAPALYKRLTAGMKADPELTAGLSAEGDQIATLHELRGRVHATAGVQTQSQDGQSQSQVSRSDDPALAFIAGARGLGFAARHVTGYVFDEADSLFHSWAEVWQESLGWIGFDPVFDACPAEAYVRLASGLDAGSTPPVRAVPVPADAPAMKVSVEAL